jgi:hypothetical protein
MRTSKLYSMIKSTEEKEIYRILVRMNELEVFN